MPITDDCFNFGMIKLLISYKIRKFQKSRFLFQAEGMMLETSNFLCNLTFEHRTRIRGAQKKLGEWSALMRIGSFLVKIVT